MYKKIPQVAAAFKGKNTQNGPMINVSQPSSGNEQVGTRNEQNGSIIVQTTFSEL